jgi:hypothetical protein
VQGYREAVALLGQERFAAAERGVIRR